MKWQENIVKSSIIYFQAFRKVEIHFFLHYNFEIFNSSVIFLWLISKARAVPRVWQPDFSERKAGMLPTFSWSGLSNCLFLRVSPCLHDPSRAGCHAAPLPALASLDHSAAAAEPSTAAKTHLPVITFKIKPSLGNATLTFLFEIIKKCRHYFTVILHH